MGSASYQSHLFKVAPFSAPVKGCPQAPKIELKKHRIKKMFLCESNHSNHHSNRRVSHRKGPHGVHAFAFTIRKKARAPKKKCLRGDQSQGSKNRTLASNQGSVVFINTACEKCTIFGAGEGLSTSPKIRLKKHRIKKLSAASLP